MLTKCPRCNASVIVLAESRDAGIKPELIHIDYSGNILKSEIKAICVSIYCDAKFWFCPQTNQITIRN
ncbi:unnamed protein product [marine sediment metagenome]|uniref:Uncharacterized protein n=1 Tax=marine sediment metagenome TaxID=412755 RepID=X1VAM1_9ZZZZ